MNKCEDKQISNSFCRRSSSVALNPSLDYFNVNGKKERRIYINLIRLGVVFLFYFPVRTLFQEPTRLHIRITK